MPMFAILSASRFFSRTTCFIEKIFHFFDQRERVIMQRDEILVLHLVFAVKLFHEKLAVGEEIGLT